MSKAHEVNKGREVEFADGVVRRLRPLTIRQLRKFVPLIEKMGSTDATNMSDADIDLMVEAAQIILSKVDKVLSDDSEAIEDAVDVEVFAAMMDVAMGNNNSPNV